MQPDGSSAYLPSEEEMDEVADLTEYIDTAVGDVVALADALLEGEGASQSVLVAPVSIRPRSRCELHSLRTFSPGGRLFPPIPPHAFDPRSRSAFNAD